MIEIIWRLPSPATAIENGGALFQKLLGRTCILICTYEDDSDDGVFVTDNLVFNGVEAFKATYHNACTHYMIQNAYGKLVDLGATEWLISIKKQLSSESAEDRLVNLRHLMIYFDDGPCYEFICRTFNVERI